MDESSTNPTGDPTENVQADGTAAAQTDQHTDSCETVNGRRHRPLMILSGVIITTMVAANAVLYAAPSLTEQVGSYLPDSWATSVGMKSLDSQCPCHVDPAPPIDLSE